MDQNAQPLINVIRHPGGLVATSVALSSAFASAFPVLIPQFIQSHDVTLATAGIATGAVSFGALLGVVPAIRLGPRLGGREMTGIGACLFCIGSAIFALDLSTATTVLTRLVVGFAGTFIWVGGVDWLSRTTDGSSSRKPVSTVASAAIAGGLAGPMLGWLAFETTWTITFGGVAAVALVLGVQSLRGIDECKRTWSGDSQVQNSSNVGELGGHPWIGATGVTAGAVSFGAISVLAPVSLTELRADTMIIAVAFLFAAVCEIAATQVSGRVPPYVSWNLFTLALAVLPIAMFATVAANTRFLAAAAFVVTGLFFGLIWTAGMAAIADSRVGTIQGAATGSAAFAGGAMAGSGLIGVLVERSSAEISVALVSIPVVCSSVMAWARR